MTIRRTLLISSFLLMMTLPQFLWAGIENGRTLEVDVCNFNVPKEIAHANASFVVVYAVQVGEDGRAIKVEKQKNDFLMDEPFVSCIKDWILPSSNRPLVVTFDWKHAEGWTEIAISGDQVDYRIRFRPGAFSQYGRGSEMRRPPRRMPSSAIRSR